MLGFFRQFSNKSGRRLDFGHLQMGLALGLALVLSTPAAAQLAEGNSRLKLPASHMNEPFENPVFLAGHIAYGGGFQKQSGDLGYGVSMIFRPGSPSTFSTGCLTGQREWSSRSITWKFPTAGE